MHSWSYLTEGFIESRDRFQKIQNHQYDPYHSGHNNQRFADGRWQSRDPVCSSPYTAEPGEAQNDTEKRSRNDR
jgi:hypothetical protein